MPKSLLRQPKFKCCGCGSFTKNKVRIQTLKEAGLEDIFINTN